MNIDFDDQAAVEARLWDEIEKRGTGMLGLTASGEHFQPMTAFVEREPAHLWFFSRSDTQLVSDVRDGAASMFIVQGTELQACIGGGLTRVHDPERIDQYWNAVVAAWYPGGRDDPHLVLLRLECIDAEVWISEGGAMRFAWQIAQANVRHRTPDMGGHAHLEFRQGARALD